MAFNPFNVFRRNQKTLFAILTVFVMFMFVLSFGKGDFFDSIPRWLGRGRAGGEVIAVVDGSKVYESELVRIRTNRTLANQFMTQANAVATNNTYRYVEQIRGQASEQTKSAVDMAVKLHMGLIGQERLDPQTIPLFLQFVQGQLADILARPNQPKDDLEVARAARELIELDIQNLSGSQGYFQNQPNQSNKDLLEYDLWLRKADKLGIDYAAGDARDLVTREFSGRFSDEDFQTIETDFQRNKQGYSRDRLDKALADEFKVRAAQQVVLGPITAKTSNPGLQAFGSPYEDYQFFREQCGGATYGVIAVPVENYVPKVTGEPSERELREIFQKYRNVEPNPATETPGLKEPRKLKLGWLEVRGDEPFYKAAAADAFQKADVQAKLAGFLIAPVGGAIAGYLAAPAPFVLGDPALQTAYNEYKQRFKLEVDTNLFPTFFGTHRPVGPSVVKPATLVAAAGGAAGSLLTHAGPFTAPLVFEQRVAVEERNQRARIEAALLTVPCVPGAGIAAPLGAVAAAAARMPQPLPLDVVRPELLDRTRATLARKIAQEDLDKFQQEMAKLGAKKDKAEVVAYLDGFVKARGLKLGGSQAFHDQYSIGSDPGLAPLKERMDRGHAFGNAPTRFGLEFFSEQDFRTRRMVPATSLYVPQPYPQQGMTIPGMPSPISLREGEPTFLVWRTEEIPAEAPKTFDAAKGKALAAWKEMQARQLAKQAAEQLAKETEKFGTQPGTVDKELRDLHEQFKNRFADEAAKDRAKYFLIENVCPIPPTPVFGSTNMPGRSQYEPFQLRPTKELPYPSPQMGQELLKDKDKPISTALVLPDQGKHVYYVAVLKNRNDLGVDEFFQKIYTGFDQLGEIIKGKHRLEEQKDARQEAVALLKVEFRVEKESPKLSEKSESSFE